MLFKDRRRAERRWRSHYKFIRRLRSDWNDHGWKQNPVWLAWEKTWTTTLCECFYDPGMRGWARFKDTPHRSCSIYECNPRNYTHGLESRPIQEWRAAPIEREDFHSRKRRRGLVVWLHKACIRCGRSMGRERHVVGEYDRGRGDVVCWGCTHETRMKTVYGFNGKRQEFDKPA